MGQPRRVHILGKMEYTKVSLCVAFFIIAFNFTGESLEISDVSQKYESTIYRCFDSHSDLESFNVSYDWTFDKRAYKFHFNESSLRLPCLGQSAHSILRDLTNETVMFSPLGHLKIIGDGTFGVIYNPNEFCVKRISSQLEIHFCASSCADNPFENVHDVNVAKEVCVRKCCLPGFIIDYNTKERCLPSRVDWKPTLYDFASVNTKSCSEEINERYQPVHRFIHPNKGWCGSDKLLYPAVHLSVDSTDRTSWLGCLKSKFEKWCLVSWRILENGSIVRKDEGGGPLEWGTTWLLSSNLSCVDGLRNFTADASDFYKEYSGTCGHELLKICFDEEEEMEGHEINNIKAYVYIFAMFASLVPLAFTIVAYWITWSSQNIHGWTVFSHIVSLFLLNLFLGITHLLSLNDDTGEGAGCKFVGIMTHFFFLSTFFWLTMVNFDLWSKFRNLRPSTGNPTDMLPFMGYALFAWGGPLLIVLTGIILESVYGTDSGIITPEYGVTRCHLSKRAEGVYLYFVIGVLILLNVGFFISLILILYQYKQSTARASRRRSTGRADITSSELFLKLFVVMGCSFALEFISWVVESNTDTTERISWVWVVFDFLNLLVRAIFIFIIFACKRQTLIEFKKLCPEACWNALFARFMSDSEESAAGPSGSGVQMTKITSHAS